LILDEKSIWTFSIAFDSAQSRVTELIVAEFGYSLGKVERGYNNRTLHVDLSCMKTSSKPVSKEMKARADFFG
jgi:hypothetical protein